MERKIILDRKKLLKILEKLRKEHKKIVLTNGMFDILHPGHVKYLESAKKLGDILVIGVNSDESIKKHKGPKRPLNPLQTRLIVLSALASVDYVTPLTEERPAKLIKIIKPDIYVKGGDYKPEQLRSTPIVKAFGGKVVIIPFVGNFSTTKLINKIIKINK